MHIYSSDYLTIHQEDGTMVQQWSEKPLTPEKFKEELSIFSGIADELLPRETLWLHDNFKLEIPENLYSWLEDDVNIKLHNQGMNKVAFTISPEARANASVINSFNTIQSILRPQYFLNEGEARGYISSDLNYKDISIPPDIGFDINKEEHSIKINLNDHVSNLSRVLDAIRIVDEEKKIALSKFKEFKSLTIREREILHYLSIGYSNQEISDRLIISLHTVQNHRKSLKRKLGIKNNFEFFACGRAFRFIYMNEKMT